MASGMTTGASGGLQYVLSGTGFGDDGPFIVFDSAPPARPARIRFPVIGKTFALERGDARFCIGRYSLDTYEDWPCPQQSRVDGSDCECPGCRQFNGFMPGFYRVPLSSLSPQQRRYNDRPHVVYLAHFGVERIKIGISTVVRARTRLLEQGARVAYILVRRESAYDARSIEAALSGIDGLTEVVQSKTKRSLLKMPFDTNAALARLRALGDRCARKLSLQLDGECFDFARDYLRDGSIEPSIADVTDAAPLRISGQGVGIVGTVLIVRTDSRQYMASLSNALGHIVTISDRVVPNPCVAGQAQMRLF